jgi:hypothetical protein
MSHQLELATMKMIDRRLYGISQISIAVILGTPLAGCILMAANYRVVERHVAARWAVVLGIVVTIGVVLLAAALPASAPTLAVPTFYTALMLPIVTISQARLLRHYTDGGGSRRSNWSVLGSCVAGLVGSALVAVALVYAIPTSVWLSMPAFH